MAYTSVQGNYDLFQKEERHSQNWVKLYWTVSEMEGCFCTVLVLQVFTLIVQRLIQSFLQDWM